MIIAAAVAPYQNPAFFFITPLHELGFNGTRENLNLDSAGETDSLSKLYWYLRGRGYSEIESYQ